MSTIELPVPTPAPAPAERVGVCHELRVHGVAGASPVNMLQLNPCVVPPACAQSTRLAADDAIVELRQPDPQPNLRAWSWGSLTSGRWYQAIYLILLPFMLANVAGWMLAPMQPGADGPGPSAARSLRVRFAVLVVRFVGLLISIIVVLWAQLVVSDLIGYQWLVKGRSWPVWTVGLGTATTALVLGALVLLTRIRPRHSVRAHGPWVHWSDPVGYAFLRRHRQHPMWNSPAINVALRRLHLSAGLAVIALVAAWPAGDLEQPWHQIGTVAGWLAIGGLAGVVLLLSWISLADARLSGGFPIRCEGCTPQRGRGLPPAGLVRWGSWSLPLLAVGLAAWSAAGITPTWVRGHAVLPALRGANLWMTIALLAGIMLILLCSLGRIEASMRQRANTPGILMLAAAIGSTLGAGVAEQISRLLPGWCPTGQECATIGEYVDWLAVIVVTILAMVMIVLIATVIARRLRQEQLSWQVAARDLTEQGSWLNALLGTLATVASAGATLWAVTRGGLPPTSVIPTGLAAVVVTVLLLPAVAAAVIWSRRKHKFGPVVIIVVAAAVAGAVATGLSVQVLGIPLPPTTFREFALTIAVVVPTAAVLRRIYTGLRSQEVRRTSGVLWDVGTFWPRWFHPFAPPTYSDRAVTHLIQRIEAPLGDGEDALIVAAHSQGSIIAGTAIIDANPSRPVALLTFGSPWHHLYTEFFPTYFGQAATADLADQLPRRWRNLFRTTDPIGGAIGQPDVDGPSMADDQHRVHSDYWLEPQYHLETEQLAAELRNARRTDKSWLTAGRIPARSGGGRRPGPARVAGRHLAE